MHKISTLFIAVISCLFISLPALAELPIGQPHPWQLGFQEAASPVGQEIHHLHNTLLYIITGTTIFVLLLLIFVCLRFNKRVNPVPSKTSHNTAIEVVWTVIPVLILIFVAVPSLRLLYYMDRTEEADMTLKVTGYQWYWGYEYPDHQGINFESRIIPDEEIDTSKGQLRLLEVDNRIVLPVNKNIRLLITANDVIHSFAVPSLGVKTDAVPGRTNETWIRITKPGVYYGQCSELCGALHGFMPIAIEAVPEVQFNAWVRRKQASAANNNTLKFARNQ